MQEPIDKILEYFEREKKIKLPLCIFNNRGMILLGKFTKQKNPHFLSSFYKYPDKYLNLKPLESISEELNKQRIITESDKKLIQKLANIKSQNIFFDIIGNLFYIANIIDEMSKYPNLSKTIYISLLLFIFLNLSEAITRYISELVKIYIENQNLSSAYKEFLKKFKQGEHPEIGKMIDILETLGFLEEGDSIFASNKILRNKISHANIYYDKDRDILYLTNGNEYSLEYLKNEVMRVHHFLLELLYQYNNKSEDLIKNIRKPFNYLSKAFQKIGRSPELRMAFHCAVFEWEK